MILAIFVIVFFLLHIQFFVRYFIFGTEEVQFFNFTIRYLFDRDIAVISLCLSAACLLAFVIFYQSARSLSKYTSRKVAGRADQVFSIIFWPLLLMGLIQIVACFWLAFSSNLNYHIISKQLETSGFIFELRIVFLLLLSALLLNVHYRSLICERVYRPVLIVVALYVFAIFTLQARSRIFEVFVVIAFSYIMWNRDRIKPIYFLWFGVSLVVPNLIAINRLDLQDNTIDVFAGLMSFEYTVLFNNVLSAAIEMRSREGGFITFLPSLALIIPSPIRSALDLSVEKDAYYAELSVFAGLYNGGFSLLAELYTNFGWGSVAVFAIMGLAFGLLTSRTLLVGRVGFIVSATPLWYAAFILAMRNDLGVFVKYTVQLYMLALVIQFAASSLKLASRWTIKKRISKSNGLS